jgi:succinate dehydrogenase / fumarate reductase flavoprotein subunit
VPRDIATREIFQVCVNEGMGVGGENQVYLDLTHKDPEYLTKKLGGILEIYEKFVGVDPALEPMKIFPAFTTAWAGSVTQFTKGSYNPAEAPQAQVRGAGASGAEVGLGMQLGALNNMMTNVKGLYAFGEVNFAYHGANRLGANALLSCIFDGLFCGVSVVNYVRERCAGQEPRRGPARWRVSTRRSSKRTRRASGCSKQSRAPPDAASNPYQIGKELGDEMTAACTVVRTEPRLEQCLKKLAELKAATRACVFRRFPVESNQSLTYARAVGDMLAIADAIAQGRTARKESPRRPLPPRFPGSRRRQLHEDHRGPV